MGWLGNTRREGRIKMAPDGLVSSRRTKMRQFLRRYSLVVVMKVTISGSAPAHDRSGGQSKIRIWTLGMPAQYLAKVLQ